MRLDKEVYEFILDRLSFAKDYKGGILACCPFHNENTPSFFVYFDSKHKQQWWYKCHGCELSGSLNTLLRRLHGHQFVKTEREIISEYKNDDGVVETVQLFDDTMGYPEDFRFYNQRGIASRVAKMFGFRFDLYGPAAIMPIYTNEQYLGYVRRNLDPTMPRYHLSAGMDLSKVLWGLDAVDTSLPVYITEGIIDAACIWSYGKQAVSLVVKGSYEHKLELLELLKYPRIVPDNDKVGLSTANELAVRLGAPMVFIPAGYKDVSEYVMQKKCLPF